MHQQVAGILLAAGAGRRMGAPKALVTDESGTPWVVSAARALAAGGCAPVIVVVGAEADAVRASLAGEDVTIIAAAEWAEGMSASLRAGLAAAGGTEADAAMVHVVDIPDVDARVVARLRDHASPTALTRTAYGARRHGHPVLIGRDHWAGVGATTTGDAGARGYLARRQVGAVDCSDLAAGDDVDGPDALPPGHRLPPTPA